MSHFIDSPHTLTVTVTYRHDSTRFFCGDACPGHAEWDEDARAEHEYSVAHPTGCSPFMLAGQRYRCRAEEEVREYPDENELDLLPSGEYRVRAWVDETEDACDSGLLVEALVLV